MINPNLICPAILGVEQIGRLEARHRQLVVDIAEF
jgi:hypothetical protein